MELINELNQVGYSVRQFTHNDKLYNLAIFCNDGDFTEVFHEGKSIKIKFDSSTNMLFNDIKVGRIRYPHDGEIGLVFEWTGALNSVQLSDPVKISTGISEMKTECYLDAEVFIVKYILDCINKLNKNLTDIFTSVFNEMNIAVKSAIEQQGVKVDG